MSDDFKVMLQSVANLMSDYFQSANPKTKVQRTIAFSVFEKQLFDKIHETLQEMQIAVEASFDE